MSNPPVNGKIQGLFKAFECVFQELFKANFIQGLFKTVLFSSLCEPCTTSDNVTCEMQPVTPQPGTAPSQKSTPCRDEGPLIA